MIKYGPYVAAPTKVRPIEPVSALSEIRVVRLAPPTLPFGYFCQLLRAKAAGVGEIDDYFVQRHHLRVFGL